MRYWLEMFLMRKRQELFWEFLSVYPREDTLMWHFDKNGGFSVKSIHKMALATGVSVVPSCSKDSYVWWRKHWVLNLHSKIKIFCCKACLIEAGGLALMVLGLVVNGMHGVGVAVKDTAGSMLEAEAYVFNGVVDVDVAEMEAIWLRLPMDVDRGWMCVALELDALKVVNLCA
ncbi:hypothetical protein Ddye_001552 [Dipteronia dyeriana]|uniref:Uncharacterized protein n=1 Tax=Dipteronia dyeriana TaxID=168575 RepID=A0AAD9XQ36_9ROSI|nr:hypothetical protein Ddye_001552 [Dipteronia dyeriana]